jgi:hypothetical protein
MRKSEVIFKIKANMSMIKSFGVKKIGIFGSVARDKAINESDIDIVVEFEEGRGGFKDYGGIVIFLEELFGKDVDVITYSGIEFIRMKPVKESIIKDLEYV